MMSDNLFKLRNNLKKKFRSRKNVGGWISYSHPSITETFIEWILILLL